MKKHTWAFLLVVAAFIVFVVYRTSLFPGPILNESFGSAFFPHWLCGLMAFLCLSLFLENRKAKDGASGIVLAKLGLPAYFIAAAVLFALILPAIGFVVCALAFLFGSMVLCKANWRASAAVSALMTAGVYLVFKTLLKVPLPTGTVWENFL